MIAEIRRCEKCGMPLELKFGSKICVYCVGKKTVPAIVKLLNKTLVNRLPIFHDVDISKFKAPKEPPIEVVERDREFIEPPTYQQMDLDRMKLSKETIFENKESSSCNSENKVTVAGYIVPSSQIAFVFSCPGREEELANHVCAGITGRNLNELLWYLNGKRSDVFQHSVKERYTITNASDRVHYPALTDDSEASLTEIMQPNNLERLRADLSYSNIVICMGNKALLAVKATGTNKKIIMGEHLSFSNLNRHIPSDKGTSAERSKDRIHKIGDMILEQF